MSYWIAAALLLVALIDLMVTQPLLHGATTQTAQGLAEQSSSSQPLIIGHRGGGAHYHANYREDVGENTLASIRRGAKMGSPLLEVDIDLTSDGIPVLWHGPPSLGRTHSRDLTRIASKHSTGEYQYKNQNRRLLGSEGRIPTLVEALQEAKRNSVFLYLDIKFSFSAKECGLLTKTLQDANAWPPRDHVVLYAKDLRNLDSLKSCFWGGTQITYGGAMGTTPAFLKDLKRRGASGIDLQLSQLNQPLVDLSHRKDIGLKVWAFNMGGNHGEAFPANFHLARQLGVDGITTDDIVMAQDLLRARPAQSGLEHAANPAHPHHPRLEYSD